MKGYMEVGEYGCYGNVIYRCVEDKVGNGCQICDLRKEVMKITDKDGLTICDVIRCGENNRPDKKNVYFVKKWARYKR